MASMPAPTLMRSPETGFALAWFAFLAGVVAAVGQGIHAPFLLDDFGTLGGLQELQHDGGSPYELIQYALNNFASRLGRPLALLSFAPQFGSWPGHPEDFLWVNVLLHGLNASLLAASLIRILALAGIPSQRAVLIGLLGAALWAAAPIHVGTVLYAVQRMTLLAATFVFAGLWTYLAGRQALAEGRIAPAAALMSLGVGGGTALGVLSKETAGLMPALVLVLELTVLRPPAHRRAWQLAVATLLVLPTLLVVGYLAWEFPGFVEGYSRRAFTMSERLLTEARLLGEYLRKMLFPPLQGMRLYYDDVPVSRSLFEPWTTAMAVIGWLGALASALALRRRAPFFAAAVLWFLVAHSLEGSFIPLEIAYDHRNYVPAVMPLLLVAVAAAAAARFSAPVRGAAGFAVATLLAYSLFASWQAARLRAAPLHQAALWVHTQPGSQRSHMEYALLLARLGLGAEAAEVMARMRRQWPADPGVMTKWYQLGCEADVDAPPAGDVVAALQMPQPDFVEVMVSIGGLVSLVETGQCERHPPADVERVVRAALEAPHGQRYHQWLAVSYARIARLNGQRDVANRHLDEVLARSPSVPLVQQRIAWALEDDDAVTVRRVVETYSADPRLGALQRWSYRLEIAGMWQLVNILYDRPAGDLLGPR